MQTRKYQEQAAQSLLAGESRKVVKRITREQMYQQLRQRALDSEALRNSEKKRYLGELETLENHAHKLEEMLKQANGVIDERNETIKKLQAETKELKAETKELKALVEAAE